MHKFKIFKSSAGSGKTFTLTKEYLKLALLCPSPDSEQVDLEYFSPRYFRHILAVTFTNDAANEMKARILEDLSKFARQEPGQLEGKLKTIQQEIEEEYGLRLDGTELIRRAKMTNKALLHNYSDFSVSTIDSFNKRIVDCFKKDLELPFEFELELETEELLEEAAELLQQDAGNQLKSHLGHLLVSFAKSKVQEQGSWDIGRELRDFGENLFKEEPKEAIDLLKALKIQDFSSIATEVNRYLNEIKEQVQALGERAVQAFEDAGLEVDSFTRKAQGIGGYFDRYRRDPVEGFKKNANTYHLKAIEQDNWFSKDNQKKFGPLLEPVKDELVECFINIEAIRQKQGSRYALALSVKKNIYLLGTLLELQRYVDELKAEKNQVPIADINTKINRIVEREPVPYIYERLGERYHHILIDEFQDTSQMQWHNLIPLVSNALSKACASLVVGDAKQAIYRWRGGKAEMLASLPALPTVPPGSPLADAAINFNNYGKEQNLGTNWRSKANIVDFNNTLFEYVHRQSGSSLQNLQKFYNQARQEPAGSPGGSVTIELVHTEKKDETYLEATFARTLAAIKELAGDEEHPRYADIAILVRNNKNASFIARRLIEEGLQVISGESLLLSNSAAVRFIINFMQVIQRPQNPQLRMAVLNYLATNSEQLFPEQSTADVTPQLFRMAEIAKKEDLPSLTIALKDEFNIVADPEMMQLQSVYEVTEDIIRLFRLNRLETEQIYLQKLLDMTLKYTYSKNHLPDFLEYWERRGYKVSVRTPDTGNAIRIMTIHKSKGLEFPSVIVPFACWEITSDKKLWWKAPEQALTLEGAPDLQSVTFGLPALVLNNNDSLDDTEFKSYRLQEKEGAFLDALNTLYVAFTRPCKQLYIISRNNIQKNKSKKDDDKELHSAKNVATLLGKWCDTLDKSRQLAEIQQNVLLTSGLQQEVSVKQFRVKEDHPRQTQEPAGDKKPGQQNGKQNLPDPAKAATLELKQPIHTENRYKIRMRREAGRDQIGEITLEQLITARDRGILVHYAFEKVRFAEDIPAAVEDLLIEGLVNRKEASEIQQNMQQVVKLPQIAHFYQSGAGLKIKNEQEVLVKQPDGRHRTLRPDRIVRDGDTLVIIDYKTGAENQKSYRAQLREYARAFAGMGYKNIRKFIVYTEELKAVAVD